MVLVLLRTGSSVVTHTTWFILSLQLTALHGAFGKQLNPFCFKALVVDCWCHAETVDGHSFCFHHSVKVEDKVCVCIIWCNFDIQLGVLNCICVFILDATPVPSIPLNSVE